MMASRKRGIDAAGDSFDGSGGAGEDMSGGAAGGGFNKRARNPDGQAVRVASALPSGMEGVERSRAAPSLVLHVRALPTFTTEQELRSLLTPFGPVTQALITQHNHQAFVQMASLDAAEAIVRHSAQPPGFQLRGKAIFLQYSNRKEIVAPANQQHGGAAAAAGGMGMAQAGGHFTAPHGHEISTPNRIVLLTVTNLRVPVTLEHIHAICKGTGGEVARIVTFVKKDAFKALVQFTTVEGAIQAKQALEGKDIFQNCCHVSVSYSSLPELKITTPSAKARDFLAESMGGEGAVTHTGGVATNQNAAANIAQQMQHAQAQAAMGAFPMDPMNPFAQQMAAAAAAATGMNPFAMQQAAAAAAAAQSQAGGAGVPPNPYAHMANQMGFGFPGMAPPQFTPGVAGTPGVAPGAGAQAPPAMNTSGGPGCVLLASNLPLNIKPEEIFKLFGVYGDVMRVKILFNKRDSALVQFKDAEGCRSAIAHLHNAPLASGPGTKGLNVSLSKHNDIALPRSNTGEDGQQAGSNNGGEQLTADFSQSKIHRFKKMMPGQAPNKNVFAPSQVLHVANLPAGTTEDQLRQLFGVHSVPRLFTTDPRMAYVLLPSLTEAMWALIHMHNYRLNGQFLRVSFSSKDAAAFNQSNQGGSGGQQQQQQQQQQQVVAAAAAPQQSFFDGQPLAGPSGIEVVEDDAQFADADGGMDGQ